MRTFDDLALLTIDNINAKTYYAPLNDVALFSNLNNCRRFKSISFCRNGKYFRIFLVA